MWTQQDLLAGCLSAWFWTMRSFDTDDDNHDCNNDKQHGKTDCKNAPLPHENKTLPQTRPCKMLLFDL